MTKRLPPYGRKFVPVPASGIRVAIGPTAWDFSATHRYPIMVLPDDASPDDFIWSSDGGPALIYERGTFDDSRLIAMAKVLIIAGASSVVALREALLHERDPRVFFDPEVHDVT